MPSATGRQMGEAVANCRAAGVPFKRSPAVRSSRRKDQRQIRNVSSPADLLGRSPVRIDGNHGSPNPSAGESVLVTGGCGPIGSELLPPVGALQAQAGVLDQAEARVSCRMELRSRYPDLELVTEIGGMCFEANTG